MQSLTNHASFGTLNPELLDVELSDELQKTRNYLISLATSPDFVAKMQVAFGNSFGLQKVEELAAFWGKGDFGSFPPIEMRDAAEINGARGAFAAATNTIYLSREFVRENEGNESAIASVLLEEYGHYIDSQINAIDSAGDEGEIFADIAQGKVLSESELAALKGEDDSAIVLLDGELVRIEQAESITKRDTLDFSAGGFKDWSSNTFTTDQKFEKKLFDFNPSLPNGEFGSSPVTGKWALQTGIESSIFASPGNLGDASFSYPIDLFVSLPKSVELGESFTIKTGVAQKSGNAAFDPTTTKGAELPNAGFNFTLKPLTAEIKDVTAKTPFGDFNNVVGINVSVPQVEATIDYQSLIQGELSDPLQVGKLKFAVPEIKEIKPKSPRIVSDLSLPEIVASGTSDNVIEGELDLDRILALSAPPATTPLLGLGNEISIGNKDNKSRLGGSISYDLLDLKLRAGVAVQQDFTFNPNEINVSMALEGQSPQAGTVGDGKSYTFTAPSEGCGLFKVKAQYELTGSMRNVIGILPKGSLDFTALQAEATLKIGEFESPYPLNIGPVLSVQLPEGGTLTDVAFPLFGSPSDTDLDKPLFPVLNTIKTSDIGGVERDDKKPQPNATKNLIVEVEYEIPYNLPVSVSDASVIEGDSGTKDMVFSVTLRDVPNEAVTLSYTSSKGSGTVTIAAGQTSGEIKIPVTGDTAIEADETFTLTVKDQNGKLFADCKGTDSAEATGTIIDDDGKPDQPKDGGKTYNDPRIVTLDKQYHDFQAVGEFVLVESTSGDLKIQVRQEALGTDRLGSVSENTAVATVLAGQRIGIYRDRGLLINGNPTTIANNDSLIIGDGRIYREGGEYTIVYGTGDHLVASVSNRVNVSFFAKEERQGQIKGLLGNFNRDPKDDLTKRDGTVIIPPVTLSQLYNEYADSWRISQAESLFDYQPGQDTNTFTNRNFPRKKVTLRDLDPADIRRAELAIGDRISNPIVREATIIDYILTGFDESIIEEAIASLTPESVLAIVTPTQAFDDFAATTVNTPIRIDVTSNDDRTIGTPIAIANFDQTSIAGSIIRLDDNNTPDDKTDDQLIYTPTANFTGNDTFNYTVTDGTQTSTAKVTVNIATFNLANLNGSNGFTLNGINPGNFAGVSVNTLKDFNGDGFNDFIIGAFAADPNNNNAAGETYVVFGKQGGFPASIDLPKLDGSNGFILNGIDINGFSGGSVSSAGDINGDGLDDIVIGAFGATANGQNNAGKTYVVFGAKGVYPARLNLSELNGNNGFVVNGINEFDYLGLAVSSAGDINADGIDDLLMSAPGPLNGTTSKSYVMYGHKGTFAANINSSDINGSNGFVINDNDGKSGTSVSAAGDINGDGIDDIIINAEENDSNNYVIFGSANGFTANFNLSELNGSNGFILDTGNEKSGTTVSKAGDINGDTIDDLIISLASSNSNAGKTYILLGNKQGFAPRFDVSQFNGKNGFALVNNIDGNSISAVSGAGDINGDGIDDLAISASQANLNAGKTYILFGDNAGFTPSFYLSRINGTNGIVINGVKENDLSGTSLSQGGDINGDNIDDLVIGSPGNLFNNSPGQTHVVFGSTVFGSSEDPSNLAKLLFDSRYYITQNPDVRAAVSNGLFRSGFEHFIKLGLDEGRSPSQLFADDYLTNNPDVNAAVKNGIFHSGFQHFIRTGFAEGRQPDPILNSLASLEVCYLSENPDVQAAIKQGIISSGLEHLIRLGMFEGRSPFSRFNALSETFNAEFYLAENPDVKQAVDSGIFRSALEHFVNVGLFEGRNPGSQFSNSSYLANYPDIADAVSNGIFRSGYEHFIKFGFGEERFGVENSFGT